MVEDERDVGNDEGDIRYTYCNARYDNCRRCGTTLEGFTRAIGVCHSCVGDSNRMAPEGIPSPYYGFSEDDVDG